MKPLIWQGCYDEGWKGVITPAAFAHPAKFSRGLIKRVLDHMLARGYIKRGDTIGDPFGGIGTGGIEAAYRGLHWVGVELEEKFVGLANANFRLHAGKWDTLGLPRPVIIQGDSRRFDVVVQGVVTSPPFAFSSQVNANPDDMTAGKAVWASGADSAARVKQDYYEPRSDGQIATLRAGAVDAVISSPPYSDIAAGAGGLNTKPAKKAGQQSGRKNGASQDTDQRYGDDPAQIAKLQDKSVEAVITSPPYADSVSTTDGSPNKEPENYWSAMLQVYSACYRSIKPSGHICVIVKNYVKNKQIVPLCDDTLRLLCHVGFKPVERIHAMLVEETSHAQLFGADHVTRKERKSFFRRLAEKKGSPRIDFEEVLICRKQP